MTPEQKAAFVYARAAMLNTLIAAMQAENSYRQMRGEILSYKEEAFFRIYEEYSHDLSSNAMLKLFLDL